MEAAVKNVSSENGAPGFRKCVYPYCRNMAVATTDYCHLHEHSSLLVKHLGVKNPAKKAVTATETKVAAKDDKVSWECPRCSKVFSTETGLNIHIGQMHRSSASVKQKVKAQKKSVRPSHFSMPVLVAMKKVPGPMESVAPPVTIVLTADEALEAGIALALADMISATRFKDAHKISDKIFRALIAQVPQEES